jgi:hypothetical protein
MYWYDRSALPIGAGVENAGVMRASRLNTACSRLRLGIERSTKIALHIIAEIHSVAHLAITQ